METQHINDPRRPVQLQKALIPVCKMVIKFGVHCNEFQKNIQRAFIQAAEELLEEDDIEVTSQAIAIRTGMDRRTIAEYRNDQHKYNRQPLNKMDVLLLALKRHSDRQQSLFFNASQLIEIIDNIHAGHVRAGAVITELIANGYIRKKSADQFKLNLALDEKLNEQRRLADEVDIITRRLFQTFDQMMFSHEGEDNLVQQTIVSDQIPQNRQQAVMDELQALMARFNREASELLASHQTRVPSGTFRKIGCHQFQFISEL